MKLFILPHAGGSAKSYCAFKHFLPQEIELVPLEPSGRGARLGEPFFDNIPDCVTDLIDKNLSLIKVIHLQFSVTVWELCLLVR